MKSKQSDQPIYESVDDERVLKDFWSEEDTLICECYCISANEVRDYFAQDSEVTLEKVLNAFPIGKGCGSCMKNKTWFDNILGSNL
jgi:bacterioferritin-associated ferredoxin